MNLQLVKTNLFLPEPNWFIQKAIFFLRNELNSIESVLLLPGNNLLFQQPICGRPKAVYITRNQFAVAQHQFAFARNQPVFSQKHVLFHCLFLHNRFTISAKRMMYDGMGSCLE